MPGALKPCLPGPWYHNDKSLLCRPPFPKSGHWLLVGPVLCPAGCGNSSRLASPILLRSTFLGWRERHGHPLRGRREGALPAPHPRPPLGEGCAGWAAEETPPSPFPTDSRFPTLLAPPGADSPTQMSGWAWRVKRGRKGELLLLGKVMSQPRH